MYVDYTGVQVAKGDHMVTLYSPEILTAQEELRRASRAVETMRTDAPAVLRETAVTTLEAARAKLRRWGLTDEQVRAAEKGGTDSDHITIYAPIGGTVIERMGREGMYVETGTQIYAIAGLDEVWVMLDAYESDLPWIHYGQTVEFTTEAYPGEIFDGRIAFIDPVLNEMTRTVKVRVNVSNPDGKLKPEMFVRAVVRAQVATGGRVMDPGLAGKWISPMHPEIVKDGPGTCDICGMTLVRAEDLGYVPAAAKPEDMPLIIPASAPLITGRRAIVYVQVPDAKEPTFEGREIMLGARAADYYLVRSGLEEGERVVTNGNFKIDSAVQILAKPSMMTPEGGGAAVHEHGGHAGHGGGAEMAVSNVPLSVRDALEKLVLARKTAKDAITADDVLALSEALNTVDRAVRAVDVASLPIELKPLWQEYAMRLRNDAMELGDATSTKTRARALAGLTATVGALGNHLGVSIAVASKTDLAPAAFRAKLAQVFSDYAAIQQALAHDDAKAARDASAAVVTELEQLSAEGLANIDTSEWHAHHDGLLQTLDSIRNGSELGDMRQHFLALSNELREVLQRFGLPDGESLNVVHCPMAFGAGKGGDWLQRDSNVQNPYLGQAMLQCGEVRGRIQGPAIGTAPTSRGHEGDHHE
jgi:Cu(I)/Ag(I) efflux system membrane fusion protein